MGGHGCIGFCLHYGGRHQLRSSVPLFFQCTHYLGYGPYFLLAGPYILHTAGHVNVDILYRKLPFKLAGLVDCLTYALIVVVTVIFIDQSLPIALNAYASGETSFTSWNPPVWPVKALIPIAFLLLLMQALAEIIWAVKRIQGQEVKA